MIGALLATAILFAQAAPAADAAPAAKPDKTVSGVTVNPLPKPATEVQANTIVCHDETPIGSKFPKKVCGTKRQLADRAKDDKDVARDFERSTIGGPQPH